ncbi:MAG TPA: ATP-binding protein [Thermoanaerobaculia bacterium]|nr:ATP-binding protein [Thermoanaerobaculia bacterium]
MSFPRVADLLPEPMLLVTPDGGLRAANAAARRLLGIESDGFQGALQDLVAEPAEEVVGYLKLCSRTRHLTPGSLTLRGAGADQRFRAEGALYAPRDGTEAALVLLRLRPREVALHQFLTLNERIEELHREVARRKRTEDELRNQREWLRVTLDSIGDAVIATDTLGQVTFINPTAERLTGWSQAEAQGVHLDEVFRIVNEETRRTVESPVAKVLREGTIIGLANHTILLARDGGEIPIDDSASPIRTEEGDLLGVVLIFHDIVERRNLERELSRRAERLAEADRRKDEFLAMLAHELRNPLAPIRNALHILGVPDVDPAMARRARETMERQIRHMVRLVDDLLDVSRITRGKVQLRQEKVDLAAAAARAGEAVRHLAEDHGCELIVKVPSTPVLVEADPVRLDQVLWNLLNNAAKFTEPGGRIWLEVEAAGGQAIVRVRDTGVGIPPDLLPNIFEPFVQGNSGLDRAQGGLGIGLTLVRSLVEMHGGRVAASSEGSGRGTELEAFLPQVARAELPAPLGQGAGEGPGALRRVLVVDDNQDAAETVALILELWGHEVRTVFDGPAALEAAPLFLPEVILLDIGLPGLDGYEVARRLRADPRQDGVLLIAMTGYGQDKDRALSQEAGFSHHLVKPVDPATLRTLLAAPAR